MYDITSSICETFCLLYLWYHNHYVWQHNPLLITTHSAYVWHHLHYRRRHFHSITPRHNLYDFISNSGISSQPLYQTLHQLYLCNHNLSTEITPNFVWHLTHYMCDIICTIYHHIHCLCHHTTLLMTAQTWHMKPHRVCSSNYPLSMWHHSH